MVELKLVAIEHRMSNFQATIEAIISSAPKGSLIGLENPDPVDFEAFKKKAISINPSFGRKLNLQPFTRNVRFFSKLKMELVRKGYRVVSVDSKKSVEAALQKMIDFLIELKKRGEIPVSELQKRKNNIDFILNEPRNRIMLFRTRNLKPAVVAAGLAHIVQLSNSLNIPITKVVVSKNTEKFIMDFKKKEKQKIARPLRQRKRLK